MCGRQADEAIWRCASGSGNSASPWGSTAGGGGRPGLSAVVPSVPRPASSFEAQPNRHSPATCACAPSPAGCWSASACSTRSAAAAASNADRGPSRWATHQRSSRSAPSGSGSGMPAAQNRVAPVTAPELQNAGSREGMMWRQRGPACLLLGCLGSPPEPQAVGAWTAGQQYASAPHLCSWRTSALLTGPTRPSSLAAAAAGAAALAPAGAAGQ